MFKTVSNELTALLWCIGNAFVRGVPCYYRIVGGRTDSILKNAYNGNTGNMNRLFASLILLLALCVVPVIADEGNYTAHPAKRLQQPPSISDLPVYPNIVKYLAIMEFTSPGKPSSYTITFVTTDDTSSVMQWYAQSLRNSGWNSSRDAVMCLSGRKKRSLITITATNSSDKKFKSNVYVNYRAF